MHKAECHNLGKKENKTKLEKKYNDHDFDHEKFCSFALVGIFVPAEAIRFHI